MLRKYKVSCPKPFAVVEDLNGQFFLSDCPDTKDS